MAATAKNREYWEKRFLQIKASEIRNTEAYERALQPELNSMYRALQSEADEFITKYANSAGLKKEEAQRALLRANHEHWEDTLEQFEKKAKAGGYQDELDQEYYKSRIARLQDLNAQLKQHTSEFAGQQVPKMQHAMSTQFKDTYMRQNFNIQAMKGNFTANFAHFNSETLATVVSKPWQGSNFSQRLWKNYRDELPSMLMNTLATGTLLGYSPAKITSQLHAQFQDIKRNVIHRLVVSEMGHVAEEANAKAYEENDIDQYEYTATLESHTCEICGKLDGQIFDTKDRKPGENYPLIHPRCRCTTMPYMDDLPEIGERWARDPKTGKGTRVKNVSFDDWQKMVNGEKPMARVIDIKSVLSAEQKAELNKLGDGTADEFEKTLANAPENMQKLFATRDKTGKIKVYRTGGSYFKPATRRIQFDASSYAKKPLFGLGNDVLFHELGHSIDFQGDFSTHTMHRYLKRSVVDGEVFASNNYSNDPKYGLQDILHQEGMQAAQEIYDEFSGSEDYMVGHDWARKYIGRDATKWKSYADISDIINAATEGKLNLGFGHSTGYWKSNPVVGRAKVPNGNAEAEFFAEATSATIANPESLAQIKKYFPQSYKIYLKMVDDIIKDRS